MKFNLKISYFKKETKLFCHLPFLRCTILNVLGYMKIVGYGKTLVLQEFMTQQGMKQPINNHNKKQNKAKCLSRYKVQWRFRERTLLNH